jgi:hypothetical protein
VHAARAPQRNHVGLGDQQHRVREVADHLHRAIHPAGTIEHDEVILVYQQVEKASQFRRGRDGVVRLLRAGQQMKAIAIGRHQAIEQRTVHAMQVLQGVDERELRPQIQLQGGVADGSEIHQHHASVSFLQGDGGIHGGGGGAGSALGVQKSEDAGLAGAALRAAQGGGEAGKGFDQGFAAGA